MIGMRLAILGGGPAGYAAAATAAHLGAEVTLIEDNQLGGNCTMTDAIPSKTLLTTADAMLKISQAEEEGVDFARGFPEVNLRRTLARARAVALHQSRGVRERMDGMNVRVLPGRGVVISADTLRTRVDDQDIEVQFDALLVCTGASPFVPPFARPDGHRVLTTRQVFDLRELARAPGGAGGGADRLRVRGLLLALRLPRHAGVGARPDPAQRRSRSGRGAGGGVPQARHGRDQERPGGRHRHRGSVSAYGWCWRTAASWTARTCCSASGCVPNTTELGLESAGVKFGDRGTLPIDEFCRTNVENVYACGDVTGQIMLANTAAMHGRTAAMHALGLPVDAVSYTGVAWCVFTRPEIAKAGISERQARIDGMPVSVTKHLIRANPRAVMENETDGIIKLLSDPDDGTVLGGAMVGLRASEVITTVALAVHAKLGVQALAETAAVNPSMSESLQRTAEKAAEGMIGVSRVTLTS